MQTVGEPCSKLGGFFSGHIMKQFSPFYFPQWDEKRMKVHDPEYLQVGGALNVHNISLFPSHTVSISVVCWAPDKKRSEFQVCLLCRPVRQLCTAVTFRSFRVGIQNRVAQGAAVKVSFDTVQTNLHIKCNGSQLLEPDINEWHSASSPWSAGW